VNCQICGENMSPAFIATVLCKHEATFDYCESCGFLSARNPHWLEEAYSSAIASTDTGLVMRNISIARRLAVMLYFLMGERGHGHYLDAAGGYGMLTRLMRDYGFDFYWSDKYCENLLSKGFEFSNKKMPVTAVTAFEVLEHVQDPLDFINRTLLEAGSETIIFTTELFEGKPPMPESWWYYAFNAGQHISFYQEKTLRVIADKLGCNLYMNNNFHLITKKHFNPNVYNFVTGRLAQILSIYVQKKMQSKTFSDFEFFKQLR
jgi:Methyltransferase domain